jgi:hypothetical protein
MQAGGGAIGVITGVNLALVGVYEQSGFQLRPV